MTSKRHSRLSAMCPLLICSSIKIIDHIHGHSEERHGSVAQCSGEKHDLGSSQIGVFAPTPRLFHNVYTRFNNLLPELHGLMSWYGVALGGFSTACPVWRSQHHQQQQQPLHQQPLRQQDKQAVAEILIYTAVRSLGSICSLIW